MKFHEILRGLIEERELTQKQLAQDLKIAPSTIGGYVQGTSEPDFDTLRLLARYFGVSADFLLDLRTGKAENHAEDLLLNTFRQMTPKQQSIYLEQGKVFLKYN